MAICPSSSISNIHKVAVHSTVCLNSSISNCSSPDLTSNSLEKQKKFLKKKKKRNKDWKFHKICYCTRNLARSFEKKKKKGLNSDLAGDTAAAA